MVKDREARLDVIGCIPESSTAGVYGLVFEAPALSPASRL